MIAELDLLRHGPTTADGRLLGRTDAPLTDAAAEMLRAQADRRRWRTIVSSPLGRAAASAAILGARLDTAPRIDPDWREIDFGDWDGRPLAELQDTTFDAFLKDPATTSPPGGESWASFLDRVMKALDRIAADQDSGPVVAVTHAGAIRAALAATTGLSFDHLWRLRLAYATRVTLRFGRSGTGARWGEIVEIVQP
jgi:alpha-ribazole phosphatase